MNAAAASFDTHLCSSKDVLITYGDPRPLHRDLELHLLSIGVEHKPFVLEMLKDGLSALSLYLVSRPRFETLGWTLSLQTPPRNFFFTGSAGECTVIGRAFAGGVAPAPRNLFFAQITRPVLGLQTSSVEVADGKVFRIVEEYCLKSDQQVIRFLCREDGVALVSALPDADKAWIGAVPADELFGMRGTAVLKELSTRGVTFHCGCDLVRILRLVADLYRDDPEDLFRGESGVEAECPRCGTTHSVRRQDFDRVLAGKSSV